MSLSRLDHQLMARAIELAKRARYTTSPNPRVGCVLSQEVKGKIQVISEGYHIQAGGPHAEIHALQNAKQPVTGATAYVTLEPCSHFGRTPPCAQSLIDAGVAKVVIGMTDPNPKVSGRGIKMLQQAGIEVITGCLTSDCEKLNPGFIKRMQQQRPYVRLKLAASLDGRTAMASGESQWITGAAARADVQKYRAQSCAIITGSGTVLADEPSLLVRAEQLNDSQYPIESIRQPIRVVIDNQHRILVDNKLFSHQAGEILLVSNTVRSSNTATEPLQQAHVSELTLSTPGRHIALTELLDSLAQREINEIWVEAGAELAGAFIEQELVDELILYQAPMLLAENSKGLLQIKSLTKLAQAKHWCYQDVRLIGQDLRLTLTPNRLASVDSKK